MYEHLLQSAVHESVLCQCNRCKAVVVVWLWSTGVFFAPLFCASNHAQRQACFCANSNAVAKHIGEGGRACTLMLACLSEILTGRMQRDTYANAVNDRQIGGWISLKKQ